MNKKNRIFLALACTGALMITSCNSSGDSTAYDVDMSEYGSVAVTGFSLKSNGNVLNNLDSVFFSIDLNSARIFNADSLPFGTDVSSLAVVVTTDNCSAIHIYSPSAETDGEETDIDYIDDEAAKVNFAKGPVRMQVVSADGENKRDYYLSVNVHKIVPDSLYWSEAACTVLPTTLSAPVEQKTVRFGNDGNVYCYTYDGTSYSVGVSYGGLFENEWQTFTLTDAYMSKKIRLRTITACNGIMYALAEDGELMYSTNAYGWNGTGKFWHSIIGAYEWNGRTAHRVLGTKAENGKYVFVSDPFDDGASGEVPSDFPVSGSSAAVEFTTKWSEKPQIVILGGRTASGSLSGATWAYDGAQWAKIGNGMPAGENYTLFPYTISETDTTTWRITESEVLLALGGRTPEGVSRKMYCSRDMGMTWKVGSDLLQLPEYMPAVSGADAIVYPVTMSAEAIATLKADSKAAGWNEIPLKRLPLCVPQARAVSAIETWECPFIYLFGGMREDGTLQNAVWRGVINHFTFRPLE